MIHKYHQQQILQHQQIHQIMIHILLILIDQYLMIMIIVIKNWIDSTKNNIFILIVLEQKRDLERITVYEIALNDDCREYQQELPQNENVK